MRLLFLFLILTCLLFSSFSGYFTCKKLLGKEITSQMRIRFYQGTFLEEWLFFLLVFIFSQITDISFSEIGIREIQFSRYTWLNVLVFVLCGVMALICLYQTIMCLVNKEYRKKLSEVLQRSEQKENLYETVLNKLMLPKTGKEKHWFSLISLSAGICEEVLFRGALISLLISLFPFFTPLTAGLLSCLLFAAAHSYQGIIGVLKTGLIGVLFLFLYYVTDSLLPGIVLHFLVDFSSAFLLTDKVKAEALS